jgi:hypothetical protein
VCSRDVEKHRAYPVIIQHHHTPHQVVAASLASGQLERILVMILWYRIREGAFSPLFRLNTAQPARSISRPRRNDFSALVASSQHNMYPT